MGEEVYLTPPLRGPDLNIPPSHATVDLRIIDTTSYGICSTDVMFMNQISGFKSFTFPSFSFLVSNKTSGKHVLFDLGIDKNWETSLPESILTWIKAYMPFQVEKNVNEILDADAGNLGITSRDISTVIWSHHHFDHRGDIRQFPPTTELVVGPGFLKAYTPAYPTDPDSTIREDELTGRPVRELNDQDLNLEIGGFKAYDFFGDGSFYILSTPGHTHGHVSALARVTVGAPGASFVFMGGDCAHYPAVFRPSEYTPLPANIPATPGSRYGASACPGQWMVDFVHPTRSATRPFLRGDDDVFEDRTAGERSIALMQGFDCNEDVLVIIAHDSTVLGNLDFYPKRLNNWKVQGRKGSVRWRFCGDLDVKSAMQARGHVEKKG